MVSMSDKPQLEGFEILQQLGEGGAARVYLARQHSLDRHVAIKCLRQDRIDDEALARLSLEASTLAQLSHPGIVAVHDVIARDDGVFMVMEYLPGGSLRDPLDSPMSLARALQITVQLARALEYAHDHGLVHRDLKPENILFRENGMPVITDFGIVFHLDTHQSQRLTRTGTFVGTPTYLSPEQISGERASAQSDLYSLGVMLHEMLTGKPPFQGETTNAIIYGHLSQPPPPLPEPFSPLQPVLDGLLAKEPEERFDSAQAFLDALRETLRSNETLLDDAVGPSTLSVPERLQALGLTTGEDLTTRIMGAARSPVRSRRWLSVAAAGVGVLVIGAVSLYMVFDEPAPVATDVVAAGEAPDEAAGAPEPTITVLPFTDMSPDRDQGYFGEGLAEEVRNLLAGIEELRVTGRTSSLAIGDQDLSIPEIGERLGVVHILQGSVRRSGERLRVTSELVDAASGFQLWSERFERRPDDIFEIQDEIANSIARALQVTLKAESIGTDSLEAYELFLQARSLMHRRGTEDLEQARGKLDRALMLDPDYAPALAASGELWVLLGGRGSAPRATVDAAALQDLQRALELDDNLAEAHAALGLLALVDDPETARVHLQRALEINPRLIVAKHWKANLLVRKGRLREALALRERVVMLDPLFIVGLNNLAGNLRMMGEFDRAAEIAQQLKDDYPDRVMFFGQLTAGLHLNQGKLAQALAVVRRAQEIDPAYVPSGLVSAYYALGEFERALKKGRNSLLGALIRVALLGREAAVESARSEFEDNPESPLAQGRLWIALIWSGYHQELLEIVEQMGGLEGLESALQSMWLFVGILPDVASAQHALGQGDALNETLSIMQDRLEFLIDNGAGAPRISYQQSRFHALSGNPDQALEHLEQAISAGYIEPLIADDPAFVELRDDSRFVALTGEMIDRINAERALVELPPLSAESLSL
jgi:eukaryotic-like serine/threonine-protein kinase